MLNHVTKTNTSAIICNGSRTFIGKVTQVELFEQSVRLLKGNVWQSAIATGIGRHDDWNYYMVQGIWYHESLIETAVDVWHTKLVLKSKEQIEDENRKEQEERRVRIEATNLLEKGHRVRSIACEFVWECRDMTLEKTGKKYEIANELYKEANELFQQSPALVCKQYGLCDPDDASDVAKAYFARLG